jgi:hypothetical protein
MKMKLIIRDEMSVEDLQQQFSSKFPYLKLELFTRRHDTGEGTSKKRMVRKPEKNIGEYRKIHTRGAIFFDPKTTVARLEELFETHYGLFVQVFRKSGKAWLETVVTDHWTLEEQNRQGEELSRMHERPD